MADDRRKIIAEINSWIANHVPFREQSKIKAEINRRSNEEILLLRELINDNPELSSDNFNQQLKELKEKEKQRQQDSHTSQPKEHTGEGLMSDTNTEEKLTDEEQKFYDDNKKDLDGADIKSIKEAYKLFTQDPQSWQIKWEEYVAGNTDSKNNDNTRKNTTEIDENEPASPSQPVEEQDWMKGLLEQYREAYQIAPENEAGNKYVINNEPNDEGLLITIEPKEEGKTGTTAQYYDRNHFAICTSTKGVEPKDQSFEHFKNHIAIAKENGSDEITMGNTKSAVFRTKLAAAVLATEGMSLATPLKETDSLDFSNEALKEIPVETQTALLKFALENGAQLENPILDFNNEAVKNLPKELQYKYLATLLQNEETKGQIKNAPEIEFFAKDGNGNKIEIKTERKTVTAKDADGNIVAREDGSPRTIEIVNYEPNPALKNLKNEELAALRTFKREQQIAKIRSDNNNKDKVRMHDKVAALRQQLKDNGLVSRKGADGKYIPLTDEQKQKRQEAFKDVTEKDHGVNFYKYAQKHAQNTN